MKTKPLTVLQIIPSGVGGIQSLAKSLKNNLSKEKIEVINIQTYTVNISKNIIIETLKKIFIFLKNIIEINNIVNDKKNIIIHNHIAANISFWENSIYSLIFYSKGIKFIFHVHSSLLHIEYKKSNIIGRKFRDLIFKKCYRIIALSDFWKNKLLEIETLNENNIVVINNFIEFNKYNNICKYESRKKLNIPPDKKIIFGFGRLVERKGFQYVLEAIPEIAKKRQDFIVYIGGKGEMEKKYKKMIKEFNITNYVKLVGFIPDESLKLWFISSDIFILPSLLETFPIVMLESLSYGRPIIASKIAAIPEVINNCEFGLLTNPCDSKDIENKIQIALDSNWNEPKIKNYSKSYTWNSKGKSFLDLYYKIYR